MAENDAHSLRDQKHTDEGARGTRAAHPGSAVLQEKAAIDAGLTGDKVAHNDVAASPLGTDDEAGGGQAGTDRPATRTPAAKPSARDPNYANERPPRAPWVWIVVAVGAALALAAALLGALGG